MQDVFKKQLLKSRCSSQWKKVGLNPHHGIVIMLSALHSKTSPHCGEFFDLIPMIKWCKSVGLDFIQLLPLNDTGFDNSPYNPTSTLALNPIYLNLHALISSKSSELLTLLKQIQKVKPTKQFNYSQARALKFRFLEKYFEVCFPQIQKLASYTNFKRQNTWVQDYALFCALCEEHQTNDWRQWPQRVQKLTPKSKKALISKFDKRINFYTLIQYLCFKQLSKVKSFANKNKFFLMGDLPFLVSRSSFDVWHQPHLFKLDYSVGSPPDDLTPEGQNWDFPAYNWQALKSTNYRWWKNRLKMAEKYFHIYRLDHIIGFFSHVEYTQGKKGKDGLYMPEDASTWLQHGADFLSVLIENSSMLPIGEDLVIPQTIKDVLRELGICGTNILTWQRTGAGGLDFVPYPLYTAATITHLASHDTVTLEQWWKKHSKVAKLFCQWKKWRYSPQINFSKRREILRDSHQTSSLFHANLLSEYLALFPEMVHKDYNLERINYPGTPSNKNWKYRFVPSVEQITASRKLRDALLFITRPV